MEQNIRQITDLRAYRGTPRERAERDVGAGQRHVARIVEAATANAAGLSFESPIRCRRRPKRVPCTGHIIVRRQDLPSEIQWACGECGDTGLVHNWRGTPWDVAGHDHRATQLAVYLRPADYKVIELYGGLDASSRALVLGARRVSQLVVIEGTPERLEWLCAAIDLMQPRARPADRDALERIRESLALRLGRYHDRGL
ncbi:MAG: hypothetical protein H6704_29545 [Myxococcales bacterium]|nr:hypothetical protein [Myxococcales bacterium]